ncbi:Ig-like domain-containing protein [Sutcliffiella horikoshii]|uniref:Ig-like domain-containing protein n=1 Tax=Sutcliffiella horikoshii TaxID=79883 RepID=UPI00203DDB85|nr:Ig-like domain-containing protein [Sutcliffiella horikoshii]MCM3617889.1 Ig-like domain-containing protein [Sutcliffiella horikoshii]
MGNFRGSFWVKLLLVGLLVLGGVPSYGSAAEEGTRVSGTLMEDTTWTKAGSPYRVVGPLTIPKDVTLTIEPGVTVVGQIGVWLHVYGKLLAIGNAEEPITIDTAYIQSVSLPETLVHIEYANVTRGYNGGFLVTGTELLLKNNQFSNGSISINIPTRMEPTITNNIFHQNATLDVSLGTVDTIINSNTFLNTEMAKSSNVKVSCKMDCTADLLFSQNNFFGFYEKAFVELTSNRIITFDGSNNYWGTTDEELASRYIIDADDNINFWAKLAMDPISYKPNNLGHPLGELSAPIVQPVGDSDEAINGLTDADSLVEVWNGNEKIGESLSNADGTFSVSIPKQRGEAELTIVALDSFNRISYETTIVVLDTSTPDAPIVNEMTDAMGVITGTAEPAAKILVFRGETVLAEGYADEDGRFSLYVGKQKADTTLEIQAEDAAKNKSERTTIIIKDVTPPEIPQLIEEITDAKNYISGTAEPGSTIIVRKAREELARIPVQISGAFEGYIGKQKAGTIIEIIAVDNAQNGSHPLMVEVKDGTPPNLYVYSFRDNMDSLYGVTELGATVTVMKNGISLGEKVVRDDTEFKIDIPRQKAGTILTVLSKDPAGNVTSADIKVIDSTPPNKPVVDEVTDKSSVVTGKAEPLSTVEIFKGSTLIGTGKATEDGLFTIPIAVQNAGTALTISAKDAAGNVSQLTKVTVKDVTPPSAPQVNKVTNKASAVTGKVEKNATVTVKIGTKSYSSKADADGNYSVSIPVQNANTTISVTAKDSAGNVSDGKSVTVSRVAPDMPTVNSVSNKASSVSGKAEKSSTVAVKIGSKSYTGKADNKGDFKITIPVQNADKNLTVTATDKDGKVSASRTVTVKRVAPDMPAVNKVTNKATAVSGKTEKNATVSVKIGSKTYSQKADGNGNYKITIPVQNAGTSINVTAKDSSGAVSAARTVQVERVAPDVPVVNSVKTTSTSVTGKAEKKSTVTAKIGTKSYSAKVDANGNFKITIPKQKKGTTIKVTAKDSKSNVSAEREIKVT